MVFQAMTPTERDSAMSQADIILTPRTSDWISVVSGNAKPATYAYMRRFCRYMDTVCFGTEATPNTGTLAVKAHRLPALKAHIEANGLTWGGGEK